MLYEHVEAMCGSMKGSHLRYVYTCLLKQVETKSAPNRIYTGRETRGVRRVVSGAANCYTTVYDSTVELVPCELANSEHGQHDRNGARAGRASTLPLGGLRGERHQNTITPW